MNYTIRFHLGRGEYHGFYQIRGYINDNKQGPIVEHVNPETHTIVMSGCKLHNKMSRTKHIFNGNHKEICAYVICEDLIVIPKISEPNNAEEIKFNPKQSVNWRLGERDEVVDFKMFDSITTIGKQLFNF